MISKDLDDLLNSYLAGADIYFAINDEMVAVNQQLPDWRLVFVMIREGMLDKQLSDVRRECVERINALNDAARKKRVAEVQAQAPVGSIVLVREHSRLTGNLAVVTEWHDLWMRLTIMDTKKKPRHPRIIPGIRIEQVAVIVKAE